MSKPKFIKNIGGKFCYEDPKPKNIQISKTKFYKIENQKLPISQKVEHY